MYPKVPSSVVLSCVVLSCVVLPCVGAAARQVAEAERKAALEQLEVPPVSPIPDHPFAPL